MGTGGDIWSRLNKNAPNGCWEWTGAISSGSVGYGTLKRNGTYMYAHRLAYQLTKGEIPEGMNVLHTCDNPPCCNPEHLWLGTIADNVHDMMAKGRWAKTKPRKDRMRLDPRAKMGHAEATAIRERYAAGELQADLATEYGVHNTTISKIIAGTRYKGSIQQATRLATSPPPSE